MAVDPLGGITVRLGTTPQGQGHRTVVAQVVADELGCAPDDVTVLSELDTATTPWTVASGQLLVAVLGRRRRRRAGGRARRVREKVDAVRAHLGEPELSLRKRRGDGPLAPGGPSRRHGARPRPRSRSTRRPNLDPPDAEDRVASSGAHGFVVDICAVEVDRATGAVTVTDYASVHDAGTLLNPLLADGQVRGGFAHGVGAALFERHVYDDDGNLMTASLVDYLTPTAPDIPALVVDHLESPSPFTALGAKGLGEGTTMSAPVAIANAVADALGVRRRRASAHRAPRLGADPPGWRRG